MKSKNTILSVMLCAIVTGQVFAANHHKIKGGLLGADNVPQKTTLLRSTLEPGHNSPDSAVTRVDGNPVSKVEFSYNISSYGDLIKETTYIMDYGTNTWYKNNSTEEYGFDANGNQILYIYTYYENNVIDYVYKEEYSFNPYGMPLWEKYSEYKDGEWTVEREINYQYDNNGILIGGTASQEGVSIPLTVTGTPDNLEIIASLGDIVFAKMVYHYDWTATVQPHLGLPQTIKLLASETYYPSKEDGTLQLGYATTYKYDDAGQLIEKTDIEGADRYWKTEYAYNANGKKISELFSMSDNSGGPYILYTEREYQYVNNRLETITEINSLSTHKNITITTFYYSAGASIKSPEAAKVSSIIATDGYITFIIPDQSAKTTLQLIDLTGRIVLNKQAESGKPVATPSLSGVYIYRILSGSVSYSGKLLIQK